MSKGMVVGLILIVLGQLLIVSSNLINIAGGK